MTNQVIRANSEDLLVKQTVSIIRELLKSRTTACPLELVMTSRLLSMIDTHNGYTTYFLDGKSLIRIYDPVQFTRGITQEYKVF
jgi:hypothetical protein